MNYIHISTTLKKQREDIKVWIAVDRNRKRALYVRQWMPVFQLDDLWASVVFPTNEVSDWKQALPKKKTKFYSKSFENLSNTLFIWIHRNFYIKRYAKLSKIVK